MGITLTFPIIAVLITISLVLFAQDVQKLPQSHLVTVHTAGKSCEPQQRRSTSNLIGSGGISLCINLGRTYRLLFQNTS